MYQVRGVETVGKIISVLIVVIESSSNFGIETFIGLYDQGCIWTDDAVCCIPLRP